MKAATLLSLLFAAAASALPTESNLTPEAIATNSAAGLRLLRFGPGELPKWFSEEAKLDLMRAEVQFMDVTETWEVEAALEASGAVDLNRASALRVTFPAPSHQSAVTALTAQLSTTNMNATLTTLSALNNRYYTTSTGAQGSTIIRDKIQSYITQYSRSSDVSVALYTHSWAQPSIIAKFAGTNTTAPMVILGAHMDSINLSSPTSGRAPGADDDGSGTVNVIEIARVLLANSWKPAIPVEFHWYAGEEAGLLGSNAIATSYKNAAKTVKAMMELDMTAYYSGTEVIALETDYIDSGTNAFVRQLISAYSRLPAANDTPCGYACSDHASWYNKGYPTTMIFEAVTGNDNPRIHSSSDTITQSGFSWAHSLEFAKVALGFVYELSA